MENIEEIKRFEKIKNIRQVIEERLATISSERTFIENEKKRLKTWMNPGDHIDGVFYCPACDEIVLTEKTYEVECEGDPITTHAVCEDCAVDS